MKPLTRLGDSTDHGGVVITAASPDLIEGKPIFRVGDTVTCPIDGHGTTVITTGDPTTLINGGDKGKGDRLLCTRDAKKALL